VSLAPRILLDGVQRIEGHPRIDVASGKASTASASHPGRTDAAVMPSPVGYRLVIRCSIPTWP